MVANDFRFRLNVSVEGYTSKQQAVDCLTSTGAKKQNKSKMAFKEENLTVSEFIQKATNGYTFCNLFEFDPNKKYWISSGKFHSFTYPVYKRGTNNGAMKLSFKSDDFFKGAQVIFVDIDNTHYEEINDYIDALTYTPTCTYCSYSDNILKGGKTSRRFRMVYVFDEILSPDTFKSVSEVLYKQIVEDTDEPMDDNCGQRVSQYMNGTIGGETYVSGSIYSVKDFVEEVVEDVEEDEVEDEVVIPVEIDSAFVSDMTRLSYSEFMHYNSWKYNFFYRTENSEWIDNSWQYTDDNYLSLYYNVNTKIDGEKRRKTLFERMCLRRVINPDATPETILFNAYVDTNRYFDNSDGVITVDCLKRNVINCFKMTIDEIKERYAAPIEYSRNNRPEFIVRSAAGLTKKETIGAVRKMITDEEIGASYDTTLTVAENLEIFHSAGIKVSKSRIYQWLEDNGLKATKKAKKDSILDMVDSSKSIRENLKILTEKGIKTNYRQVREALAK